MIDEIANLPEVSFIDNIGLDEIQEKMKQDYQSKFAEITGRDIVLSRGDPITLILYAVSVQIMQAFLYVDRAGKQNLLKYSYGEFLENLAAFKGISREGSKPARTTVRFTLSAVRPDVVSIPAGTRVTDGNLFFAVEDYREIPAGESFLDVPCVCLTPGEMGNLVSAGGLNVLVDPIPYMASVMNIDVPTGGVDIESDESLAERVYYAPSSYSVAGPDDAYRYWVKTFNASIMDVYVDSPVPTEVIVEFIMQGGDLPTESMVRAVEDFLQDEKIRPLTDQVTVKAPETMEYTIDLTYYVNSSDMARASTIQRDVSKAVDNYISWQCSKIGRDINPSRLIQMVIAAGAKRVELKSPTFTVVGKANIARLGSMAVAYGGIEDD